MDKWYIIVVTLTGRRYAEEANNEQQAAAMADTYAKGGFTFSNNTNGEVDIIPVRQILKVETRYGKLGEVG